MEKALSSHRIEQGYLFISTQRSLPARRSDDAYNINLKVKADGLARHEVETEIDAEQGQKMLDQLCVEKAIKTPVNLSPMKERPGKSMYLTTPIRGLSSQK
jgi:CYTH domain-containing protein